MMLATSKGRQIKYLVLLCRNNVLDIIYNLFHPKDGSFLLICTSDRVWNFFTEAAKGMEKVDKCIKDSWFVYRFQEALIYPLVMSSVGIPGNSVAAEVPGCTEAILLWEL